MLTDLIKLHNISADLLSQMEELQREAVPDRARLATLRWRMTQASAERMKLLEYRIFPALLSGALAGAQQVVTKMSVDGRARRRASAEHVARWSLEAALADWDGYRSASAAIRTVMLKRIWKERDLLIPLLERLESLSAARSVA